MVREREIISVIIPVYNVSQYLNECLTSVCSQTYKDLQIIVVDDGSTDDSGSICDKWASADNRITVIHQENAGLSAARNTGLDIATGDYIAFVDSDDYLALNAYEKLLEAMKTLNGDVVFGNLNRVESDNIREMHLFDETNVIFNGFDFWKCIYDERLNFDNPAACVVWTKLYKKEIWTKLRFPVGEIREDEAVLLDIFKTGKQIAYINEQVYFYRIRESSIIHSKHRLQKNIFYLKVSRERVNYFLLHNQIEYVKMSSSKLKQEYFELYMKAEDKKEYYKLISAEYKSMADLERQIAKMGALTMKERAMSFIFCFNLKIYILVKKLIQS